MSKIASNSAHFGDDDATLKELILNTACKVQAIEELLDETHHRCDWTVPHDMADVLIPKAKTEARYNEVKERQPYKNGYISTHSHGSPAHNKTSYLRSFLRNLFDPK